jgi:ATP-binding cassette subfamily B protein RaxB
VGERRIHAWRRSRATIHRRGAGACGPTRAFEPRKEKTRIALGQLIGQVTGFWPSLAQILLLSLALQVFVLIGPLFMQWILDHVIVSKRYRPAHHAGAGLFAAAVHAAGHRGHSAYLAAAGHQHGPSACNGKPTSSATLLRLPLDYFQKRHLGDIVSRTGSTDEIQRVLTSAFVESLALTVC